MKIFSVSRGLLLILLGDAILLAGIVLTGLGTHNSLALAASRFLPNFLPFALAWLVIGWPFGVFDLGVLPVGRQLWRPVVALLCCAPLFAVLRALWLGDETISVVFVLVLGGLGSVGMVVWRAVLCLILMRREARDG